MDIVMEIVFEILDFIFDVVTDILFEGTVKHMKIPAILRLLLIFFIFLVYLGFSGFLFYIGYSAFIDGQILISFLFCSIGLLVLIGGLYETRKAELRKSIENEEDTRK